MIIDILVDEQTDGNYHAYMLNWPEMAAIAPNPDDAVVAVQQAVRREIQRGRLRQVPVQDDAMTREAISQAASSGRKTHHPRPGVFANDPTYDDFLERIAEYRRNLDAQERVVVQSILRFRDPLPRSRVAQRAPRSGVARRDGVRAKISKTNTIIQERD